METHLLINNKLEEGYDRLYLALQVEWKFLHKLSLVNLLGGENRMYIARFSGSFNVIQLKLRFVKNIQHPHKIKIKSGNVFFVDKNHYFQITTVNFMVVRKA